MKWFSEKLQVIISFANSDIGGEDFSQVFSKCEVSGLRLDAVCGIKRLFFHVTLFPTFFLSPI